MDRKECVEGRGLPEEGHSPVPTWAVDHLAIPATGLRIQLVPGTAWKEPELRKQRPRRARGSLHLYKAQATKGWGPLRDLPSLGRGRKRGELRRGAVSAMLTEICKEGGRLENTG